MGKLTKVEKERLKISAEEYEKKLKDDKVSARLLKERDQQIKENMKKLKGNQ